MKQFLFTVLLSFCLLNSNGQDNKLAADTASLHSADFKLDKSSASLGISTAVLAKTAAIKNPPLNIALFGVDRRNKHTYGNADMIMILSIDQMTKEIKLSSILRDTYVSIGGLGMNKINAAFAHGGAQLAIKTINENFSMDIRDYISIDFFGSAKIIDALGGVTLNIKKEEVPWLNNYLNEIGAIEKTHPVKIINPGVQKLNGKQTVAYSRIRAVGNNDYERTERQRRVMSALLEKLRQGNSEMFAMLAMQILPNIETSMSRMTLFTLGSGIFNSQNKGIQEARFPLDTHSKGVKIDGVWYLSTDLQKTTGSLHDFIYNDVAP